MEPTPLYAELLSILYAKGEPQVWVPKHTYTRFLREPRELPELSLRISAVDTDLLFTARVADVPSGGYYPGVNEYMTPEAYEAEEVEFDNPYSPSVHGVVLVQAKSHGEINAVDYMKALWTPATFDRDTFIHCALLVNKKPLRDPLMMDVITAKNALPRIQPIGLQVLDVGDVCHVTYHVFNTHRSLISISYGEAIDLLETSGRPAEVSVYGEMIPATQAVYTGADGYTVSITRRNDGHKIDIEQLEQPAPAQMVRDLNKAFGVSAENTRFATFASKPGPAVPQPYAKRVAYIQSLCIMALQVQLYPPDKTTHTPFILYTDEGRTLVYSVEQEGYVDTVPDRQNRVLRQRQNFASWEGVDIPSKVHEYFDMQDELRRLVVKPLYEITAEERQRILEILKETENAPLDLGSRCIMCSKVGVRYRVESVPLALCGACVNGPQAHQVHYLRQYVALRR